MKPLRILLFLGAVFALLFCLTLVFPKDGISLGGDLRLKFLTSADFFDKDSTNSEYTDSLILYADVTDDPEFGDIDSALLFVQDSLAQVSMDSISKALMDSIVRVRIDSIRKRVYPIEFPSDTACKLHEFFAIADRSQAEGKLVRILHYGDSQIENDRMTSLLRYRLQKVFGGSGCGLVPAVPLYFGNPTYIETFTGEWGRYTGFGRRDSTLDHNCYGILSCYTAVPSPDEDELPSVEFEFRKGRRASKFSNLDVYLHAYADSGRLYFTVNDTIQDTIYNISGGYNKLRYTPEVVVKKIKMELELKEGGRVYGLAFDSGSGIQVDNVAMRGSSGLEFRKSDRELFEKMEADLNTGLVLMQFGGNVVPYIKSTGFYKRSFMKELAYAKKLFDSVPIIVIGPSDMATKENGKFVTWPSVEPVRNALREATLESGCAFWDMYEAMGGENSMPNFVLSDPPLAITDYVHFTPKGANLMAGMFFDALMLEYRRYQSGVEK